MTKSPPSLKKFAQGIQLDIYPSRLMLCGIVAVAVLMFVSVLLVDIPTWLKIILCNVAAFYAWYVHKNCNPEISNLRISTSRTCHISVGMRNVDTRYEDYVCESNITGWRLLLPLLVIINVTTTTGKRMRIAVFHDSVKDDEFRRLAVMFKTG